MKRCYNMNYFAIQILFHFSLFSLFYKNKDLQLLTSYKNLYIKFSLIWCMCIYHIEGILHTVKVKKKNDKHQTFLFILLGNPR